MADNLWGLTFIWEFTGHSGTQILYNELGGIRNGGANAGVNYSNQYGSNGHDVDDYQVDATYQGSGIIRTGSGGGIFIESGLLNGSYDNWRWNHSKVETGVHATFTLDTWINIIGGDGLFYDNAYYEAGQGVGVNSEGDGEGTYMRRESGELVVYSFVNSTDPWDTAIRYPTGLMMSGEQHFFIQYKEQDDYFVVGLDGDTAHIPVPFTSWYDEHVFGRSKDTTETDSTQLEMRGVRMTCKRERWPGIQAGTNTYTVPSNSPTVWDGERSAPATITMYYTAPPDDFGVNGWDQDRDYDSTTTQTYYVWNIAGGTPPYSYEWVDMMGGSGNLAWGAEDGKGDGPSIKLAMKYFSEIHPYWPVCIVTDSNGVAWTSCTADLQPGQTGPNNPWFQGAFQPFINTTWQSSNEVVRVQVGNPAELRGHITRNGFQRWRHYPDYAALELDISVSVPAGSGNGTAVEQFPVGFNTSSTPAFIPLGAPDSYLIPAVTMDDDGAQIVGTSYSSTGIIRTRGTVTLEVFDVDDPPQVGWWTNVIEAEQTVPLETQEALRPYTDAEADARAYPTSPGYNASIAAEQRDAFEKPQGRSGFTEYDVAFWAYYFDEIGATPWNNYNIVAPARLNPWNLSSPKEFGYGMAVDLAYWSRKFEFDRPATYLPLTGTLFSDVFNAAYRGAYEGFGMGQADRLAVVSKFTSYLPDPNYTGPYEDDYLSAYADGYEFGFAVQA